MALGDCHLSSCSLCPGLVLGAVLRASEVPGPAQLFLGLSKLVLGALALPGSSVLPLAITRFVRHVVRYHRIVRVEAWPGSHLRVETGHYTKR